MLNEIDLETLYKIKQMDDEPLTIIEDQLLQEFGDQVAPTEEKAMDTREESKILAADQQFNLNLQRFIESRLVVGVSPTGNRNTQPQEKSTSNKGKHSGHHFQNFCNQFRINLSFTKFKFNGF